MGWKLGSLGRRLAMTEDCGCSLQNGRDGRGLTGVVLHTVSGLRRPVAAARGSRHPISFAFPEVPWACNRATHPKDGCTLQRLVS
ncbi:hypothetical protein PGT21_008027 [Puccinia graminis f. sp. tritici]|uniref:Uncharacterized protein n=1 Tax=Puccinia graminis f. sp. tritici TaxID=56615 RepID=A0A5B0LPG0_PUCGR|nr:hypothetical protein PGTUg99_007512 [Puccinia graminis f. sp. tritici]KAA1065700.1 hypothetical protein PGT21_008027 [Puccinia graminis f. sp. tritici]